MRTDFEPAIERRLGASEDIYWRFDAVSPINFGVAARLSGHLPTEHLHRGLRAIQERHPLLRCRIVPDDDGVPWFRSRVGPIPIHEIEAHPTDAYPRLERELNVRFDTEHEPPLRVVLLRHAARDGVGDATIIMTYHHSAADGRSAVFVLRDLVESLTDQASGGSGALRPLPPVGYYGDRIHTLRDYEDLEDGVRTAWKTFRTAMKFLNSVGIPMGIRKQNELPLTEQEILVEPRMVEPDDMTRLLARAKAEGTTMQTVLNAALSLSVVADSPRSGLAVTASSQVIDVRARLHPPVGEDCGLFASGAGWMLDCDESTDFWVLARKIGVTLRKTLETPLPFFHPAVHKSFARLGKRLGAERAETFVNIMKSLHPEGFAVSNIGRVVIEVPDASVRVEELGFATNTNAINYFNTSAATLHKRLTWNFSGSSVLGRERIAAIADDAVDRMLAAIDG